MPGTDRSGWHGLVGRAVGDQQLWIEAFAIFNFGALVGDIYLAHSVNAFRREAEYVPLVGSVIMAALLAAVLPCRGTRADRVWRIAGHLVGWTAIGVGLVGVILHLDSAVFYDRTIRSLTYAAPFAAPLAYTGLGLLVIANRMVAPRTREWAEWVLLLAMGGFVGNFVFSLTDHAENGFFSGLEWIPVAAAAFATGFLIVPLTARVTRRYIVVTAAVLGTEAAIGVLGFVLHAHADLARGSGPLFGRIIYGAPPLAPLLFVNLAILGGIGLYALSFHVEPTRDADSTGSLREP